MIMAILGAATLLVPSDGLSQDTPELDRLFPIAEQRADFIVVIDRSLSMRPFWPATAEALSAFADAIPDGDHVAFVNFDKQASNSYILPRVLSTTTRSTLQSEIERVPAPAHSSVDDSWSFTDLGEALAKTLDEINRPQANRLVFVFLLTDFIHEPHPSSRFRGASLDANTWKEVVERGRLLREIRALRSFALILPVNEQAGRDISLVRAVLGEMPEVRVDLATLGPWFDRMAQEIRREKLATLVRADMSRDWQASLEVNGRQTTLQIRSSLERLPIHVTIESVTLNGDTVSIGQGQDRLLNPGQVLEFPLEVSLQVVGEPWWRWLVTTGTVNKIEASITVQGRVELAPSEELTRVGVQPAQPFTRLVSGTLTQITFGAPLWLQLLIALGIVGICVYAWRTWLRSAVSVGAYGRKLVLSGAGRSEALDLPRDRRTCVVVGNSAEAILQCSLGSAGWALTLVSLKPRFPRLVPRRGLYAYRSSGMVFYNGKDYDKASRRWVERDLPLPEVATRAIPVGFQSKLVILHGGERVVITIHS